MGKDEFIIDWEKTKKNLKKKDFSELQILKIYECLEVI